MFPHVPPQAFGVAEGLGVPVGVGDGVAQVQLVALEHDVFLQNPVVAPVAILQVSEDGQSDAVVQTSLHRGTGVVVGVGLALGDAVAVAIVKESEQVLVVFLPTDV